MRLGVYVGSFNPVHDGHIHVASYLIDNNYLDRVLLVPTPGYWDKKSLAPLEDRINMLKFYESDKLIVDTKHNNYQYTNEVMKAIEDDYDDELYLIIGSDNLVKFHLWDNLSELKKYKIIVMRRGNTDILKYVKNLDGFKFIIVDDFSFIDVSSTMIRNGERKHLKKEVIDYINKRQLY